MLQKTRCENFPQIMSTHLDERQVAEGLKSYKKVLSNDLHLAYKGEGGAVLLSHLKELKSLYSTVHRSSNMGLHLSDSQALTETAKFGLVNAKNLKIDNLGQALDLVDFLNRAHKFLGNEDLIDIEDEIESDYREERFNSFNWLKMGLLYYKTGNRAIPMDFLNGPLKTERRAPNTARRLDDTRGLQQKRAQELRADELEKDEQNTSTLVKAVYKEFAHKQEADPQAMNFFKFFINPKSFCQSVENLFYTSFLIKDGKLKLFTQDGIPMVTSRDLPKRIVAGANTSHHIASFDYETWRALIETHNITESFLPHRDEVADEWDEEEEEDGDQTV